jgi:predicted kinase
LSFVETVWVVAGAPGAGKSTVATVLARVLEPHPALLDKDTVYGPFVESVLAAAGREPGEREGTWYDDHVKAHEYAGLAATARQIREHGCPVLLVAPFTGQIRDPARWAAFRAQLGGDPVRLVWVGCDPGTLQRRLLSRASHRDAGKLARFEAFIARMTPDVPPPVPHLAVDNAATDPQALAAAIAELLGPAAA